MKIIIAGSRDIDSYAVIADAVKQSGFFITEVVSGKARGVDSLGEVWAENNDIPVKEFPADWDNEEDAGFNRNDRMGDYGDGLIAIRLGDSSGTSHMIRSATKRGLKTFVYQVKINKWGVYVVAYTTYINCNGV